MPKPSRASIAPEASVQFEPWNGPPSNWVIGSMRGKPSGLTGGATGSPPRSDEAASDKSASGRPAMSAGGEADGAGLERSKATGSAGVSPTITKSGSGAISAVVVGGLAEKEPVTPRAIAPPTSVATRNTATLAR